LHTGRDGISSCAYDNYWNTDVSHGNIEVIPQAKASLSLTV
jgi:hypothetical protein